MKQFLLIMLIALLYSALIGVYTYFNSHHGAKKQEAFDVGAIVFVILIIYNVVLTVINYMVQYFDKLN